LHSIEARINPENTGSSKILTKLAFIKEGYFKENYFYNGAFLDSEIYSLVMAKLH
jgi:ribosomal-protein-alanine N-acetyltransferase